MSDEKENSIRDFAESLKGYKRLADEFEQLGNQDKGNREMFAFAFKGLGVDLAEVAANIYRLGRVIEELAEITKTP